MKKLIIIPVLVLILIATSIFAKEGKKYGKALTLKDTTKISQIMEKPEKYVGKKVLISGIVVDVCAHKGCWIDIASDKPYEKIQVKVNDGEIVFPITAKGQTAVVEGQVEELKLTKEQVLARKKHEAEMYDKKFDPASVTSGETIYRIKGLGAVIEK